MSKTAHGDVSVRNKMNYIWNVKNGWKTTRKVSKNHTAIICIYWFLLKMLGKVEGSLLFFFLNWNPHRPFCSALYVRLDLMTHSEGLLRHILEVDLNNSSFLRPWNCPLIYNAALMMADKSLPLWGEIKCVCVCVLPASRSIHSWTDVYMLGFSPESWCCAVGSGESGD